MSRPGAVPDAGARSRVAGRWRSSLLLSGCASPGCWHGTTGRLAKVAGTGHVAERRRDQRRVAVLHHGIEIGRNVVLGLEIVRRIVAAEFHITHSHRLYSSNRSEWVPVRASCNSSPATR